MSAERGGLPPSHRSLRASVPVVVLLLILWAPPPASAETPLEVETEAFRVVFAPTEPRILALDVRATSIRSEPPRTVELRARDVLSFSQAPGVGAEGAGYTAVREEHPDDVVVRYRAVVGAGSCRIEYAYEIPRRGHELRVRSASRSPGGAACAPAPSSLVLTGTALAPASVDAGFVGRSERVRWVVADGGESSEVAPDEIPPLAPGRWVGVRNRYWAMLLQAEAGAVAVDPAGLALTAVPVVADPWEVRVYVGPVEHAALSAVAPDLRALLFAGRWPPIEWLAWLLTFGFERLLALTGGAVGPAIVLLALAVKAACHPLARVAERWQLGVDRTRALLEPELREVRQRYRGEERSRRTFDVYRAHGVHPLYGLRSLAGVALQVPLFFAAYHMLDEHVALAGTGFLWITDLAEPDRVAALPFALPWLGDGLNLLPILMSVATVLASGLHEPGALPEPMQRSRRRGLYAMAGGFLLLFYTFPAGMVLYWTTNNAVSLLRAATGRWLRLGAARSLEVGDAPAS